MRVSWKVASEEWLHSRWHLWSITVTAVDSDTEMPRPPMCVSERQVEEQGEHRQRLKDESGRMVEQDER